MTKRYGRTSLGAGLLLAVLGSGLSCTAQPDQAEPSDNEFGVLMEGLGINLAECTAATVDPDTGFDADNKELNIELADDEDAVISVVSGRLTINGHPCAVTGTVEPLTSTNVNTLNISAAVGATAKVVIDLLPGKFGNIIGSNGGITIDGSGSGTTVAVGIRGDAAANNIRLAEDDNNDIFVELGGNTVFDLKLVNIDGTSGKEITIAAAGGNDKVNAQDNDTLGEGNLGSTGSMVAVTADLRIYGGEGKDVLEGGQGNDLIDGGPDDDIFTTAAAIDGNDVYRGGAGNDTMDYSDRDNGAGVDVTINPSDNVWIESTNSVYNGTTKTIAFWDVTTSADTFTVTAAGGTIAAAWVVTSTLAAASATPESFLADFAATPANNSLLITDHVDAVIDHAGKVFLIAKASSTTLAISAQDGDLFTDVSAVSAAAADADDGEGSEADDVRYDVENLVGTKLGDTLYGSTAGNIIDGGDGDDTISGGGAGDCAAVNDPDEDVLSGDDGDDLFDMGPVSNCKDTVNGGAGTDTVNYQKRLNDLVISIDGSSTDGEESGNASAENDFIKTGMEVVYGGEGVDTITGSSAAETLHGGAGDDIIDGKAGDDTLAGGPGADTLTGGTGNDTFLEDLVAADYTLFTRAISSFDGADIIHGGSGINICKFERTGVTTGATYNLCLSTTTSTCGDPDSGIDNDSLTNCNHLKAGKGADTINGSNEDEILEGGPGADEINGNGGDDQIYGDADNDTGLNGGDGSDNIYSGAGDDVVDGGDGADFCFDEGNGDTTAAAVNCEG